MDVQHMFFHEEVLIFYYDRIECSWIKGNIDLAQESKDADPYVKWVKDMWSA
jgi:hypothetical protein